MNDNGRVDAALLDEDGKYDPNRDPAVLAVRQRKAVIREAISAFGDLILYALIHGAVIAAVAGTIYTFIPEAWK